MPSNLDRVSGEKIGKRKIKVKIQLTQEMDNAFEKNQKTPKIETVKRDKMLT